MNGVWVIFSRVNDPFHLMRIANGIILGVAAGWLLSVAASATAQAAAIAAPLPSIYTASTTYALKVNGNDVAVIAFSDAYDYATFSADGRCELQLTRLDGKRIARHGISPQKLDIAGTTS